MKSIHVVTILKDNKIQEIHSFRSALVACEFFGKEIEDRGIIPVDEVFDDGFFEFEDGETVCLSQDVVVN